MKKIIFSLLILSATLFSCKTPELSISILSSCEVGQDISYFKNSLMVSYEEEYIKSPYTYLVYRQFLENGKFSYLFLVFENNKLKCFGAPEEFSKSFDPDINRIGDETRKMFNHYVEEGDFDEYK